MELRNLYLLVSLGAIWGASYLFIRLAAPTFGSWWLIALRVLIAGSVLFVFSRITKQRLKFQNQWWHYVLLGVVNAALPFTLITNAVSSLNASTSAIINALMPATTAVVAAIWIGDKLTLRKISGLLIGLGGVVALVGWNPIALSRPTALAALQAILATVLYGIGNVYTRVQFSKDTPLALAVGQQFGACALQVPLAAFKPLPAPSLTATLSLLALALLCTSVASLIYFRLVASIGPARTSAVTFLTPFFSVVWGALFLREELNSGVISGMALILCSIALVMFKPTGKRSS
jgi:drug/metabolite transporter (DMT)-like permease